MIFEDLVISFYDMSAANKMKTLHFQTAPFEPDSKQGGRDSGIVFQFFFFAPTFSSVCLQYFFHFISWEVILFVFKLFFH